MMPNYRTVRLQRKYVYVSAVRAVWAFLLQHGTWAKTQALADKLDLQRFISPEICSYIFKEWRWEEADEAHLGGDIPKAVKLEILVLSPTRTCITFQRLQDPSQVEFVYSQEIRFSPSVRGKRGTAVLLLNNHPDTYFLDFLPTV